MPSPFVAPADTDTDTSPGSGPGLDGPPPSKRRRVAAAAAAAAAAGAVGAVGAAGVPAAAVAPLPVDFVCWRGGLRKLMTTPYCENDAWQFSVVKHNGTTFICEVEMEQTKADKANMDAFHSKACYWGRRFEGYCVVPFVCGNSSTLFSGMSRMFPARHHPTRAV